MEFREIFMERALALAELGAGHVSPNPMVGCVLTADGRIIGEGWHRSFGGPHAEVEAVRDAISGGYGDLLPEATAYVTLEPCSHYGKTPPCADLFISKRIREVVVANDDPNPLVGGKGLARLRAAGVRVISGVMAEAGEKLNRRFFTGIRKNRPFIILKWAQSRDGYLSLPGERIKISAPLTDALVHKWRSEEDAILVGKNTVLTDNPLLNVRNWPGRSPVRIILDRNLETAVPAFHVSDRSQPTVFVNLQKESLLTGAPALRPEVGEEGADVRYLKVQGGDNELQEAMERLYRSGIGSVLVEGGAQVLNAFIRAGLADEIRIIEGDLLLGKGIPSPRPEEWSFYEETVGPDRVRFLRVESGKWKMESGNNF